MAECLAVTEKFAQVSNHSWTCSKLLHFKKSLKVKAKAACERLCVLQTWIVIFLIHSSILMLNKKPRSQGTTIFKL